MAKKYILEGYTPKPINDVFEWGRWFETADRIVAKTKIGKVEVSTVFLGLDYSFGEGPPILFETMVFGLMDEEPQWRYSTWEEAEAGHLEAVKLVKERRRK